MASGWDASYNGFMEGFFLILGSPRVGKQKGLNFGLESATEVPLSSDEQLAAD